MGTPPVDSATLALVAANLVLVILLLVVVRFKRVFICFGCHRRSRPGRLDLRSYDPSSLSKRQLLRRVLQVLEGFPVENPAVDVESQNYPGDPSVPLPGELPLEHSPNEGDDVTEGIEEIPEGATGVAVEDAVGTSVPLGHTEGRTGGSIVVPAIETVQVGDGADDPFSTLGKERSTPLGTPRHGTGSYGNGSPRIPPAVLERIRTELRNPPVSGSRVGRSGLSSSKDGVADPTSVSAGLEAGIPRSDSPRTAVPLETVVTVKYLGDAGKTETKDDIRSSKKSRKMSRQHAQSSNSSDTQTQSGPGEDSIVSSQNRISSPDPSRRPSGVIPLEHMGSGLTFNHTPPPTDREGSVIVDPTIVPQVAGGSPSGGVSASSGWTIQPSKSTNALQKPSPRTPR